MTALPSTAFAAAQGQAPRFVEEPQAAPAPGQPAEPAGGDNTMPPPSAHATPPGITIDPPIGGESDEDGPGCPINRRPLELVV